MLKEVATIREHVLRAMLCGSRVTCRPAPTDTDQDVIVLVRQIESSACKVPMPEQTKALAEFGKMRFALLAEGWVYGGSGDQDDEFESWTNGDINLILTADEDFYNRFVAATTVCARLNLLDKDDRKAMFRAVLYSEPCYYPGPDGLEFEQEMPF